MSKKFGQRSENRQFGTQNQLKKKTKQRNPRKRCIKLVKKLTKTSPNEIKKIWQKNFENVQENDLKIVN